MKRKKHNPHNPERRDRGGFAAIPHCLLDSQVFVHLSAHAVKLLMDLATQFKGFNNGDLCLAWSLMERRGWKSRDTLNKARLELLANELIIVSRYGDRKRPNLYALTFFAVDECKGKLDIDPTQRPPSVWRLHEPLSPLNIKMSRPPDGINKSDMTRGAGDRSCFTTSCDTPAVSKE